MRYSQIARAAWITAEQASAVATNAGPPGSRATAKVRHPVVIVATSHTSQYPTSWEPASPGKSSSTNAAAIGLSAGRPRPPRRDVHTTSERTFSAISGETVTAPSCFST